MACRCSLNPAHCTKPGSMLVFVSLESLLSLRMYFQVPSSISTKLGEFSDEGVDLQVPALIFTVSEGGLPPTSASDINFTDDSGARAPRRYGSKNLPQKPAFS